MVSKNRRDFLKLCAASLPALVVANKIDAEEIQTAVATQPRYRTPSTVNRYIDPLPIPKRLIPYKKRKNILHSGTATTETIYRKQIRPVITDGAEVIDRLFP